MIDFSQLERVSRRSLRMYDLTERERRVADVIIEWSFGHGRESAVIPELDAFVDLTGVHKGNVSRALQRLVDRGIVQISGPRDARCYAFIPSAAFWKERRPLYDLERAIARASELERINGQRQLPLPTEPSLDEGMAAAARDAAIEEDEQPAENCQIDNDAGRCQIGNQAGIAKSATTARDARTCVRGESQQIVQIGESYESRSKVAPGSSAKRFRDDEKNYTLDELERLDPREFENETCRRTWIGRVRDSNKFVLRALGIVKEDLRNGKRYDRPLGKVFLKARELANAASKTFHLW